MPPLQQLILSHRCTKVVLATTGLLAVACTASLLLTDRVHSKTPDSYHFERAFPRFSIDSSATQLDTSKQSIPKVLHHVYLAGLDSLRREEELAGPQPGHAFPGYNSTVRHSCPQVHKDWQYMFWNHSQAEDLIQTSYPWFLDTFRSYSTIVQKGDAMRPLLMHAIGGLYVDIDVDCYTPTDRLLHGHQIVLQLETTEPKSLNNAAMASVPDHPFWVAVLELMLARGSQANTKFLGFKDLHTILSSTGPEVLRDAFSSYTGEAGDLQSGWAGEWEVGDSNFRVYPMGQWYEPCKWDDYKCHGRVTAADHLRPQLVGHHINAGAWLKSLRMENRKVLVAWLPALAISAAVLMCCALWVFVQNRQTWHRRNADSLTSTM